MALQKLKRQTNMTDLRKAAEMALEALEEGIDNMWSIRRENSIQALRQALAQEQEPVAWMHKEGNRIKDFFTPDEDEDCESCEHCIPLYTAPPKREWVGLEDEEVEILIKTAWNEEQAFNGFVRSIEAKLKEKNNG